MLLVAGAATTAAGCGDDAPMSRAAYVAAGTKACSQAAARLRGLQAAYARDPAGTGPAIGRSSDTLLGELLDLRPPPELEAADRRLELALRRGQDLGQSLARAGAQKDAKGIADLQGRLDTAGRRLTSALEAVGLPGSCGAAS